MDATFHESDERLELYALNRLPDLDLIRIEEHLLACDLCRDRLDAAAAFAFPMREELRNNPVPVRAGAAGWFVWPRLALAGSLAMALVALVVFRARDTPLSPVATLQLTAMRGAEAQVVAPSKELDLTFADGGAGALRVEVVDGAGARVWLGPLDGLHAKIAKMLAPGEYYVRLYDSPGHQLHEYAFRVKN